MPRRPDHVRSHFTIVTETSFVACDHCGIEVTNRIETIRSHFARCTNRPASSSSASSSNEAEDSNRTPRASQTPLNFYNPGFRAAADLQYAKLCIKQRAQ